MKKQYLAPTLILSNFNTDCILASHGVPPETPEIPI